MFVCSEGWFCSVVFSFAFVTPVRSYSLLTYPLTNYFSLTIRMTKRMRMIRRAGLIVPRKARTMKRTRISTWRCLVAKKIPSDCKMYLRTCISRSILAPLSCLPSELLRSISKDGTPHDQAWRLSSIQCWVSNSVLFSW